VGTKESVLNRIIITRSEVDLVQIKEAYKNLFNRELERDVASDTSGDYKKLLLELLKDPSQRKF
jgi:annexin A7/11